MNERTYIRTNNVRTFGSTNVYAMTLEIKKKLQKKGITITTKNNQN